MKLHYLDRTNTQFGSFSSAINKYKYFLKVWHYHMELELVLIQKSTGTRFVGDSIERFQEGDLVLIGSNLPHMWMNDEAYFHKESTLEAEAISVYFRKDFLGEHFFDSYEMKHIKDLLLRSELGLVFNNVNNETLTLLKQLNQHQEVSSFKKVITLLEILDRLANHKSYKKLSSEGFVCSFNEGENKSLKQIYEFIFENFSESISSKDVAEAVNMNASAFSRFFKRVHRKTFTSYLNEVRIGYACKLLLEGKHKILSVCYESGFNNISNFNRQFKKLKKVTPTDFLKKYSKI